MVRFPLASPARTARCLAASPHGSYTRAEQHSWAKQPLFTPSLQSHDLASVPTEVVSANTPDLEPEVVHKTPPGSTSPSLLTLQEA